MQVATQTVQEKIALRRGVEVRTGPIPTAPAPSRSFVAQHAAAMGLQGVAIDQTHCQQAQRLREIVM